jgi:hypothetical protein
MNRNLNEIVRDGIACSANRSRSADIHFTELSIHVSSKSGCTRGGGGEEVCEEGEWVNLLWRTKTPSVS